MPQLRRMAAVYKRQLSDFYLPAPPNEMPLPHDFGVPGDGVFQYGRALRYQLRQARQRRELALDLAAEQERELRRLPTIQIAEASEGLGGQVRQLLDIRN